MLISGKEKLERMRDGRVVFIGAEAPWDAFRARVDGLLERVQTPDSRPPFSESRAAPR
jgi:hypothetical protein